MIKDQEIDGELQEEILQTQIVVIAGGKAKRLGFDIPKCLLDIDGKEKLIDKCIRSLRSEGYQNFVFLLGHRYDEVLNYIGDGSKYDINPTYSIDPPSVHGWGKGKAFKHALIQKKIDQSRRSIVVFPDDVIIEEGVYSRFLVHHLDCNRRFGTTASMILVPGTEYPYGVAEIADNGVVTGFSEKPIVRMPTSVGVYAFEPDVYSIIHDKIELGDPRAVDLESTILPSLVSDLKLASLTIPTESWLPINTLKEYEHAVEVLSVSGKNQSGKK